MQDLQNYQYYDPSPQPPPLPWWKRKRTWQLAGLLGIATVVLVFAAIAATNALKNHRLANGGDDLMTQVSAIESQLGSECDEGDTVCLELARADAARRLGVSEACDALEGESFVTCVSLIAQDKRDPEVCKALSADDQSGCADTVYAYKANTEVKLELCREITDDSMQAACTLQVKAMLIAKGNCTEAGVDQATCDADVAVASAIKSGDPAVCAALPTETQQYDCEQGIKSVDEDNDGLVIMDEVELGLSDANPDSDADGLKDGDEVHVHTTDPAKPDTDGDGFPDGTEVDGGYDPLS